MIQGLPFANIAHLGWVVRDINKTVKTFEDLGLMIGHDIGRFIVSGIK